MIADIVGAHKSSPRRDREREAKNDQRLQDVFRELSSLKAQVELESAQRTAEELARREAAQTGATGEAQRADAFGDSRKRIRNPLPPLVSAAAIEALNEAKKSRLSLSNGCEEERRGADVDVDVAQHAAISENNGKDRRCGAGVIDLSNDELEPLGKPLPAALDATEMTSSAAAAEAGEQRREWAETTRHHQGQQNQQAQEFPPEVVALQRQEWGASESQDQWEARSFPATASTLQRQVWAEGEMGTAAATRPPGGGSSRDELDDEQDQPPFVVIGMLNDNRALLLPTTRERRKTMVALAEASVPVTWTDSTGGPRTAIFTTTDTEPAVYNPLPMMANFLAWMRELPPGSLPENRLRVRLKTLLAPQSPSCSSHNNKDHRYYGDAGGTFLSLGATWLLAHLMFGREAGGEDVGDYIKGRMKPNGKVSLSLVEAKVLSLLLCPLVGWSPRPQAVMRAISERRGSLRAYSVSLDDFETFEAFETKTGSKASDRAADELIQAGFAHKREVEGMLVLDQKMEDTCELVLNIFLNGWNPERQVLARVALGLMKVGAIASGMCPRDMRALLADQQAITSSTDGSGNAVDATVSGGGDEGPSNRGRMGGLVGHLCVRLHQWSDEVLQGGVTGILHNGCADPLLRQILQGETEGKSTSRLEWTGPMAQALGLLGGATVQIISSGSAVGAAFNGTVSANWVASLSKEERLLEPACLRLRKAMNMVVELLHQAVLDPWQTTKHSKYDDAVLVLHLLVRRDQGLAGPEYVSATDLVFAAGWAVHDALKGYAYRRLLINLKNKLKRPGEEQLEVAKAACDDDGVRGGDRLELLKRYRNLQRKFGNQQTTPQEEQRRNPLWDPVLHEEEISPPGLETQKQGSKGVRGAMGGRKMYFYNDPLPGEHRYSETRAHKVEEVLIRERYCSGGWLGLHSEFSIIEIIMMLMLWEEVFDFSLEAALPHCILRSPMDFSEKFFAARRKGLPGRLAIIRQYTDEQLFVDVGQRYDRFCGVEGICNWERFLKEQVVEICVAFGGRRLSDLLKTITNDMPHVNRGFPDVVLWRPVGVNHAVGGAGSGGSGGGGRNGRDWNLRKYFGVGWQGYGHGWEVEVVEVKSNDRLSREQEAWLGRLECIGVPAMVTRVRAIEAHSNEADHA